MGPPSDPRTENASLTIRSAPSSTVPLMLGQFAEPDLRLPVGRYRISAIAEYGTAGSGTDQTLTASIALLVEAEIQ